MTYPLKSDYVATNDPWTQQRADDNANFTNQMYLDRRMKLVPTAIKTTAYVAVAGQLVVCDASSAAFAVTLPSPPADQDVIAILKIDSTANKVTITRGGTDRFFYITTGPTSITLDTQTELVTLQYQSSTGLWLAVGNMLTLAALDARYNLAGNNSAIVTVKDANLTIQDDGDVTKQARFQASSIPTGTTKTFTLPNADTTLVGTGITQTLTATRVNPRINTTASSATPAINVDTTDQFTITALAAAITSMSSGLSGTPVDGQKLMIRIKDNATPRAITWGASWRAVGITLPTTTVTSKILYVGGIWNAADSLWDAVAVALQA